MRFKWFDNRWTGLNVSHDDICAQQAAHAYIQIPFVVIQIRTLCESTINKRFLQVSIQR